MKPMERAAPPKSSFLQSLNHRAQPYQVGMVPLCQTLTVREDCLLPEIKMGEIASSQTLIKPCVTFKYKRILMRVPRASLLGSGSLIGSRMPKKTLRQIPHRKLTKTLNSQLINRALKNISQGSSTWVAL
jgi:hypothetical protein